MKIVKIIGGLGNQMWQYAFLIALRERFPLEEVYYDASFFNGYPLHNGFELDIVFNITASQASKRNIRLLYHYFVGKYLYAKLYRHYFPVLKTEIREVEANPFDPDILDREGSFYYDGYWADYRYYNKFYDKILQELSFKNELDSTNKELLNKYSSWIKCSIHIRRGDYLKDPDYIGICDENYYFRAISFVKEKYKNANVVYFIFSNDIPWCKEHLFNQISEINIEYIDWNVGSDSYKDMQLMTFCQVNIIANSSFSWWGAFLNTVPDKIVIAPEKYKNKDIGFDIYPIGWEKL